MGVARHCRGALGAVEATGATLDDVNQVVIYITRIEDTLAVDEVYARYFRKPYVRRS